MAPAAGSLFDPRHRAFTIGVVAVMTLFAFEGIGIGTAMPTAASELNGLDSYAWTFNGFLIASLVGMVLAGEWCDARGPRQPLIAALTVFGIGNTACALAPTMVTLVAGRFVAGFGFGLGIVTVYVVMGRAFSDALRPRAFALLSGAWVLPSVVGPLIAGALATHASWRWVFALVVPLLVPGFFLLVPRASELGGGTEHALDVDEEPDRTRSRRRVALAGAAALALFAVQEAATRQGLATLVLIVAVPILAVVLRLLLPTGALRLRRGIPSAVVLRGVVGGGYIGAEAFVPLALQTERGVDPIHAGLVLTAGTMGWFAGSWVQGRVHETWGPVRLLRVGALLTAVGMATLPLCLLAQVPVGLGGVSWMLGACGMGMSFATLGNQVLTLSEVVEQGENSAALQLSDAVGSVLMVGVAGAIYSAALAGDRLGARTFTVMWLVMAAVLAAAAALAPRIAPPVIRSALVRR